MILGGNPIRVRAHITSSVWVLMRHLARREDCAYSSYGSEEQRRQTGWIGAQTEEVMCARTLNMEFMECPLSIVT